MKELFESGIINISKLATLMWPEKSKASASSCLYNKIHEINGNSITVQDKKNMKDVLNKFIVKRIPNNQKHLEEGTVAIYKLVFEGCNLIYVGSTINPESRLISHRTKMKLGKHHCKKLNELIKEFGEPTIEIIEYCNDYDRDEKEQYHIYLNKDFCLNKNASWYIKQVEKK